MQNRLQLPGYTIADTNEDSFAVVDSPVYKGMDQHQAAAQVWAASSVNNLRKLVETATYDGFNVILRPQLWIKDDAHLHNISLPFLNHSFTLFVIWDAFVILLINYCLHYCYTSLIHSKTDYCNSLQLNLPTTQINCLQPVLNRTARAVTKTPEISSHYVLF